MRFLHLDAGFDPGDAERRSARLINSLGKEIEHAIVTMDPCKLSAGDLISARNSIDYQFDFPRLGGFPTFGRMKRIAEAMRGHDLVLTYGWDAIDGAMAHTLFSQHYSLPPLIHHEDGLDQNQSAWAKGWRRWYRRIALGRAAAVVVPSRALERIALEVWQQPSTRVHRIADGVATARYARKSRPDVLPGILKRKGELWIGTIAELIPENNLPAMVRAFSGLNAHWQLVILGIGPERAAILKQAEGLGIEHRVHLPGIPADTAKAMGLFDIFALSAPPQGFPYEVIEAMAAGLPVAAQGGGIVAEMVSPENSRRLAKTADDAALADCYSSFAFNQERRKACGNANRVKARAEYEEATTLSRYRALYASAMGRERLP